MTTTATSKTEAETETTATAKTNADIEAAILRQLTDRPARWSKLRRGLPGTRWQQLQAAERLHQRWQLNTMKVAGRVWVWRCGPADELIRSRWPAGTPR